MAKDPGRATTREAAAREPALPLIVGIGASAGGLEAYKAFFSRMPADSGMAFVLVQHLDPQRPSMLVDLLSAATAMPVTQAEDGAEVGPNRVYIIPPNATLTMEENVLRIAAPAPPREARRPIDAFFTSLAEEQGDNAICIILSGGGSDGAEGLRAVKEHGGFTLAQAETDSRAMPGMPSSAVATGLVDDVLAVERMPERLLAYRRHLVHLRSKAGADGALVGDAATIAKICRFLRAGVGHDFSQYKDRTLMRRIQRRVQVTHAASLEDYAENLRKDPREVRLLFKELLIGVTEFFRDPDAFAALEAEVIGDLLAGKGADDVVRVWVAGCSTGEEAYSLAILLKERMAGKDGAPKVQIFATDIDEDAVAFARAGRYRVAQLEGVSLERRRKYFVQENDHWCPSKDIREMCVFSAHSAIKDPPFSKLDLISCRNLLIYLQPPAQERLISAFQYALRPGGYLFLGASESVSRQSKFFSVVDKKHRIFKRREIAGRTLPDMANYVTPPNPGKPAAQPGASGDDRLDINARRAMEKHFPAYVVVDASNEIVRFSGQVAKFLGPSPGAASLDLFALLLRPLRPPARAVLQKAIHDRLPAIHKNLPVEIDGAVHFVDLIAEPIAGTSEPGFCALAFFDRGSAPHASASPSPEGRESDLEQELMLLRERLQATIDELETNNEEMKSANEEYQSVNEELQSTNEELETSKEELQSINEELQTVNAELNSKNDALLRTNSDLRNFLDATEIATIFLDADLRIANFTPAMTELFHLRESDYRRPITEIANRMDYADLAEDVARVLRTLTVTEREVNVASNGRTFIMRIRPYRRLDNVIDGVVITFSDITDRKRLEGERALRAELVDSSSDAIISLNLDGTIKSWNAAAERLYGYSASEMMGKDAKMLAPPERQHEDRDILARIKNGEVVGHLDTVRRRKDGSLVDISLTLSPIEDASGAIVGASKVARDITDRVRAERALLESEARYRTLFEAIDEGFCIIEKVDTAPGAPIDFRYVVANPSFAIQAGTGDVVGKTIREAFPLEPQEWFDTYDNVLATGEPIRFERGLVTHGRVLALYAFRINDAPQRRVAVIFADITERKQSERRQRMLMDELNHRVKNTLATVQSIASQTLESESDPIAFRKAFQTRLGALSRTHNLLSHNDWVGSPLREVLFAEAAPYADGDANRFVLDGPDLDLKPSASLAFGMAFHELATNAAKYGAFSTPNGRVAVTWRIDNGGGEPRLRLEWRESGGPAVAPPKRRGLGSRLIERGLAHELDGKAEIRFEPAGIHYTLDAPLVAVEAQP